MEQIQNNQRFFCAQIVDFVQAYLYLHKLPFCNNAHRQVCITICEQAVYYSHMKQSGHMHVHACTDVATLKVHIQVCDTHDTFVALNLWVTCTVNTILDALYCFQSLSELI